MPIMLLFMSSCATVDETSGLEDKGFAFYNSRLQEVERQKNTGKKYGSHEITKQKNRSSLNYVYEDEVINVKFLVTKGIKVNIRNKTKYSLRVNVGEGAFVSSTGEADRLLTGSMSFSDRNKSPRPIVIPQRASAKETIIPKSKVSMGRYDVEVEPVVSPVVVDPSSESILVELNVGNTFRLILPIEIEGTVNEYTFKFEVVGARIKPFEGGGKSVTYGENPPPSIPDAPSSQ